MALRLRVGDAVCVDVRRTAHIVYRDEEALRGENQDQEADKRVATGARCGQRRPRADQDGEQQRRRAEAVRVKGGVQRRV